MLVLVAFTREPHLTVDLLVLQHVHDVVEQFPAVATNQDVWIAVCFQVSELWRYWLGGELLSFVRRSVLLALPRGAGGGGGGAAGHLTDHLLAVQQTGEVRRGLGGGR